MPKTRLHHTSSAVVAGLAMALLVVLVHQKIMGYDQEGCAAPHWSTINQGDDWLKLTQRSGRCMLEVDLRGDLRWSDTEDGIAWLTPGGRLEIDQRTADARHRLAVKGSADGTPTVEYWRDGKEATVDEATRVWLHGVAMTMFRRTGIDAEARSRRIFERAGAAGLTDEIDEISSDFVASRYARAAFGAPPEDLARVLKAVARRVDSDHSAAELLVDLARAGLPEEGSPALERALGDVLAGLGADFELRRSVLALLEASPGAARLGEELLETAARGLGSDYEAAEIVVAVAGGLAPGEPLPRGLVSLLRSIDGDYEMRRSLVALLDGGRTEGDLRELLDVTRMLGSDYDMAEVLVKLVHEGGALPALDEAFHATLRLIGSDFERERAEKAWRDAA